MRSGVGPTEHLRELGIRHGRRSSSRQRSHRPSDDRDGMALKPAARCTSIEARHTNCAVRYDSGTRRAGRNDMFLLAMNLLGFHDSMLGYGFIWMTAYQTWSRGVLRLTSRSPEIDPDLRFRMLSDERDLVRMRDGMRRLQQFGRHPAIAGIAERISFGESIAHHAGRVGAAARGRGLDQWMMANCYDSQHGAGTCRMGPSSNPRSVVDPECRVIGLEGCA